MSGLLAHAKALHAVASAFQREASTPEGVANRVLLLSISRAYSHAADALGDQMRAEASGPSYEDRPQPGARR